MPTGAIALGKKLPDLAVVIGIPNAVDIPNAECGM